MSASRARTTATLGASWLYILTLAPGCGSSEKVGVSADEGVSAVACKVNAQAQPTCPSPAPSYAQAIEPIITNNCQICHASGGIAAAASGGPQGRPGNAQNANFETQDPNRRPPNFDSNTAHDWSVLKNIQMNMVSMKQVLFLCTMPPPDASTLTQSDRDLLTSWLACGAPDN